LIASFRFLGNALELEAGAKLNKRKSPSPGGLMSRVWKARLIVVKHRRFINCQTTHSKCSGLPDPDPAQKFMRRSVCHRKAWSSSMLECLPECECECGSGCAGVQVCSVCGSFIKFARTSHGRWAVGGLLWQWAGPRRRSQRQFCAISNAIFIYNLSYSTNNYSCMQTNTHSPKV